MNKKIKRQWRQLKFKLRRNLFPWYAQAKYNETFWKYVNRYAVRSFNRSVPELNERQQDVLEKLNTDGIAVTDVNTFFDDSNTLQNLITYVEKRSDRIRTNHKKPFLEDLLSEIPELGFEIPFFVAAAHPLVLDVVNSYLGMHSRLTHFMLRRTKVMDEQLPSFSQNWHRAPQERKNCRVYIYLNDVTEGSGAFSYVPKSTVGSEFADVVPQTANSRGYHTSESVDARVPADKQMTVYGPAGTMIFCDSTGLHRGGYSTKASRVMSTFGYSAPSFRENIHYSYTPALQKKLAEQSVATSWLLQPKWQRN